MYSIYTTLCDNWIIVESGVKHHKTKFESNDASFSLWVKVGHLWVLDNVCFDGLNLLQGWFFIYLTKYIDKYDKL